MKLWIFTSGLENVSLLKILKQYNVDLVVYMNQDAWPVEDKSIDFQEKYVQEWIKKLQEEWVDKIILHPMWELKFKDEDFIFPLYQNLIKQTLKYSIVWKIWLFWNKIGLEFIESYLGNYVKNYKPTERQKHNKKFDCCKFSTKDISVWKYNTIVLNKRNWMLRKLIKTDLRYFFDCAVDSILPTTYDVYHFENIINQKKKKIHFQNMKDWEFLDNLLWKKENNYTLKLITNWNTDLFLQNKKWEVFMK